MRAIAYLGLRFVLITIMAAQLRGDPISQSGIVADKNSRNRIAMARVTAVGGKAMSDTVTDSNGTFVLDFGQEAQPGGTIRIRVQKDGYVTYDELVPVSREIPLQIWLVPIKNTTKSQGSRQHSAPSRIQNPSFVPSPEENVRESGLKLSKEILDFLRGRQRDDPAPGKAPRFSAIVDCDGGPQLDNGTPVYMKETRKEFVDRFENRIVDIHDKFSARGLRDEELEAEYKCVGEIVGNVDQVIYKMGSSIHKLAMLVPPADLYMDVSDERLSALSIDEANLLDRKTEAAMTAMAAHEQSHDASEFFFFSDFKECCLDQVEYLRAELLKRLGPSAYDAEEMLSFGGPSGLATIEEHPNAALGAVLNYSPHFRRLAIKFKRKVIPLPGPRVLHFSETKITAEEPDVPSRVLVTIQTPSPVMSGYIVVIFGGKIVQASCDFAGSNLVFGGRDVIDNKELVDTLKLNNETTTYALRIGQTPFRPDVPIHVVAASTREFHALKVLLFDE